MFGKSKPEKQPDWTVNLALLTDNRSGRDYKLTNIHTCFNESQEQVTIWYLGKFLVTIPCTKKLYNKSLYTAPNCEHFIKTDFEFEAVDTEGKLWVLEGDNLISLARKPLNLLGLRFTLKAEGVFVYFYGDIQFVFPDADVQILEQAKISLLDRKYKCLSTQELSQLQENPNNHGETQRYTSLVNRVMVTTETCLSTKIEKRLGIVTAEIALGMNIFKDIFAAFSDFFGGRNQSIQDTLREAKETVLLELKREALKVGGDAIVAVDLDYSEISGGGKSMLFLVASGTAVKLKK